MSYGQSQNAAYSDTAAAQQRPVGRLTAGAESRVDQQMRLNSRLGQLLAKGRQEPPSPVSAETVSGRRPLVDMIDRLESLQDHTSQMLEELEALI